MEDVSVHTSQTHISCTIPPKLYTCTELVAVCAVHVATDSKAEPVNGFSIRLCFFAQRVASHLPVGWQQLQLHDRLPRGSQAAWRRFSIEKRISRSARAGEHKHTYIHVLTVCARDQWRPFFRSCGRRWVSWVMAVSFKLWFKQQGKARCSYFAYSKLPLACEITLYILNPNRTPGCSGPGVCPTWVFFLAMHVQLTSIVNVAGCTKECWVSYTDIVMSAHNNHDVHLQPKTLPTFAGQCWQVTGDWVLASFRVWERAVRNHYWRCASVNLSLRASCWVQV